MDPNGYMYVDDVSGKELRAPLVAQARREEMEIIQKMGVWEVVDRPPGVRTKALGG